MSFHTDGIILQLIDSLHNQLIMFEYERESTVYLLCELIFFYIRIEKAHA